ncbi:MAG: hypothetical protein KKB37_15770 [Alphaproteobacteria bacterium]|nr:hypothetical protein [Alphaproteobacteria bacterium]
MWQSTFNHGIRLMLAVCFLWASSASYAQTVPSREELNSGTVSIITGQPGYLSSRLASDLSATLDEGNNLRVLAIAGRGAISDLIDTLLLRGIDLAVVPADVLEYVEKEKLLPSMKQKLRVVSRLYNTVAHLVAGSGIRSIEDLRGKKVNVISKYHGAFVAAQNVFSTADISYTPTFYDERLALEKVRDGEIAATLIMSGRPNPLLDEIRDAGALHFIDIPFSDAMPKTYFPIELTSLDYPDLILPGQTVRTIATPSIMMVYEFPSDSPRRAKITRFIDAFLARLTELQRPPRHPRWRDVNLGAAIAGYERYDTVAQWLQTNTPPAAVASTPPSATGQRSVQDLFRAFIASESAAGGAEQLLRLDKPELFARFKAWQKRQRAEPAIVKPATEENVSLRVLFRQFIDAEAARVGRDQVLALSKKELFDRFLAWRRQNSQ